MIQSFLSRGATGNMSVLHTSCWLISLSLWDLAFPPKFKGAVPVSTSFRPMRRNNFPLKPILIITSSQLTNCVLTVHRYLYKLFAEVTTETEAARPRWCTTKQCCSFLPIGCLKALCYSNYSNRNSSTSLVLDATIMFFLANWLSQGSLLG
jgi:hypothetical protein